MSSRTLRVLSTLVGVPLLLSGCGFAVAAAAQAGSDGSFATPGQRFATSAAALKTDEIQVGADTAHADDPDPDIGEAAKVTIVVRAADPGTPIFVGIGPKAQVEAYLRGTSYDEFVSARLAPLRPSFRRVPGTAASPPDAQTFWVARSSGTGTRRLAWDKTQGAWSAVAMRLDGRPGVDVHASIGLRFGFLAPVAAGTLAGGALMLGYAVFAHRRSRGAPARREG
ncbi:hypothetical protein [Actinomadura rugatobispora]|uniref:DUF3153 domain-containing protein n=1 Tax=Actinomadura rugatobispora TaxID=1994 RepID=A0ABW0ZWK8_9ACTN|nr:hypothetical protein GCM10010200_039960 [Actinomadura rugatobispora]